MDAVKTNFDDELIPVRLAVHELTGESKSPATLWRWAMRGLEGSDGERIRLEVQFIGRRPFTTRQLLRTWINEVTAARLARIDRRHGAGTDVSNEELQAAGLLGCTNRGAK